MEAHGKRGRTPHEDQLTPDEWRMVQIHRRPAHDSQSFGQHRGADEIFQGQ
jgi:hypothetical protein